MAAIVALSFSITSFSRADIVPSGRQRLMAPDAAPDKAFGDVVAIDGETAVIGAPSDATRGAGAGAVYVFVRAGGNWQPHPTTPKLIGASTAAGDQFGNAVAISGQSIVVGAVARNFVAGSVYLFRRANTAANSAWTEEQQLTPAGLSPQDQFGGSVSISGTTVLVGAQGDTGSAGAAYVFVRGASSPPWAQQGGRLLPTARVPNANFGVSVAISGDTVVIGAPGQTDEGAAFVFRRAGSSWGSGQALTVGAPFAPLQNGDSFGQSVAISGNWAVVGAPGADVGGVLEAGAVLFFERTSVFVARQRFDTPTPFDTGEFGRAVALAGTGALVSAPQELNEQGQVHLFSLSSSTWSRASARLSSGLNEIAGFGKSIALASDAVLVGAAQEPCTPATCAMEGAVYAYGLVTLGAAVPVLAGWSLPLLVLGLAGCGAIVAFRRARAAVPA